MESFIILSYGRSGSVLLAHNIGRNCGFLPSYLKQPGQLTDQVIHSHLLFTTEQTKTHRRVFSLRADPVETVLSFLLAHGFNDYHRWAKDEAKSVCNFFADPGLAADFCRKLIRWHDHYAPGLTSQDVVIVYEDFVANLQQPVYVPIYPNKKDIIVNYQQVIEVCQQHSDAMLASIQPFLQHVNTVDISHVIV